VTSGAYLAATPLAACTVQYAQGNLHLLGVGRTGTVKGTVSVSSQSQALWGAQGRTVVLTGADPGRLALASDTSLINVGHGASFSCLCWIEARLFFPLSPTSSQSRRI